MMLLDLIAAPLQFPFMLRALAAAMLIGVCCAVLSCFLVLRGWSLMGDAVSHAVLPGIVGAYVLGLPLLIGAFFAGLVCAFTAGFLHANSRVKSDTVLGVVFSGMFGLGLVLFTKIETDQHLTHILFGNVLGVQPVELLQVAVVGAAALAFILPLRKDLLLTAFDVGHSRAIGLPVKLLHYGLLAALTATIVISLKAVGVILVVAMLIAPGAIGYLLAIRFDRMLAIAVASAMLSSLAGVYASFYLDAATGACIVLIQALLFVLAILFAPRKGVLVRRRVIATAS
jgi:manganese/iron transport system permease protein